MSMSRRNWLVRLTLSACCSAPLVATAEEFAIVEPLPPPANSPASLSPQDVFLDSSSDGVLAAPISYHWIPTPVPQVAAPSPSPAPAKTAAPLQFPGPKTLPPTGPYKPLFFMNDFSYKQKPDHEYVFGEELKNMQSELFGETLTISTGGEIRHRYMKEDNRLRPGGPVDASNQLWRWRHYIDANYGAVRVYFEGLHAENFSNQAADQLIDVNRWDIQNLFVDWTFHEGELGKHTLRYGRQEFLFGRQRLVSPLDWANIRRNFEGVRYLLKGDDFTLDSFVVNPVNSATGFNSVIEYDNKFDSPNHDVIFAGTYFSYTGRKNTIIDAYWLYLDTFREIVGRPDGQRHTLGSRWAMLHPVTDGCDNVLRIWDFDVEGGFQFGDDNSESVIAGFVTSIVGHTWKQVAWSPRLLGQFYYGSGDRLANTGHNNTMNVLFPLGHAYWALSDNLSGQNLLDYSIQADVRPTSKLAFTSAWHWFNLASNGDTLYNVGGLPVGAPGNGRDVGTAADLYGYYAFNPNFDIQAGYSWFWYGQYIQNTTPRGDATQFYLQTSFRY